MSLRNTNLVCSLTLSERAELQSREHRLFIGWVMIGLRVELVIYVCGLVVHFVAQRAIRHPVNIKVPEGDVGFIFSCHGEMNGLVDAL
jgi:hypothetical protein